MANSFLSFRNQDANPQPITSFVVKVASRCNIQCAYCYMYEHADQTWREQPPRMSEETIDLLAFRLAEYARQKGLERIAIIAHGGEPLLLGAHGLESFFRTIEGAFVSVETKLSFGVQTNAILVNEDIIDVFQTFDVRAGVSLDGPREWNDIARLDKKGFSTFDRVLEGVEKLRNPSRGDSVFGGFLTVANPQIAPAELFAFFHDLKTPVVDFLFPAYNYETYPFDKYPPGTFGNWLTEMFDIWMASDSDMRIRTFRTLMKLILGSSRGYDSYGPLSQGVMVIETDGTYHALDVLKTAYHGATVTGKALASDPIVTMETLPLVMALTKKRSALADTCLNCRLVDVCGGGYLPHRYGNAHGFDRESVYCTDLQILIDHISGRLEAELRDTRLAMVI